MSWDEFDAKVANSLTDPGWHITYVGGGQGTMPWAYTTGLTNFGHSELVIMTLPPQVAGQLLNLIGFQIKDGRRYHYGEALSGVLGGGYTPRLIGVSDPMDEDYPQSVSKMVFGEGNFTSMQVVWPDAQHRYPWDDGYDKAATPQPLLGPAPQ